VNLLFMVYEVRFHMKAMIYGTEVRCYVNYNIWHIRQRDV
jgi:hypothetical protein